MFRFILFRIISEIKSVIFYTIVFFTLIYTYFFLHFYENYISQLYIHICLICSYCLLFIFQCDGVLCDGPSPENAASTVVDCRNVNNGKIGFFRIGFTPKSTVEEIFEKVLKKHNINVNNKSDSGISTISIKEDLDLNVCHNEALEVEGGIEIHVAEKTTLAFPPFSFLGSVLARSSSNRGGKSKHCNTHR